MIIETPHQIEAHKGVLALATEAFKYLALANGGGAIALLSKSTLPSFAGPTLAAFALGLLSCGMAVAAMLAGEILSLHWDKKETAKVSTVAVLHLMALVAVLISSAAFAFGAGVAVGAINVGALSK